MSRVFNNAFRPVYGLPCWGVRPGYGTFLTLEFGQPHLRVREPKQLTGEESSRVKHLLERRTVTVHGDWHLWVYCCNWAVHQNGTLVGDSTSEERIKLAAEILDGQALESFDYVWRGCKSHFTFDLGARLVTSPCDRKSEQWLWYQPTGKVLTLRADKKYSHQKKDAAPESERWHAIPKEA